MVKQSKRRTSPGQVVRTVLKTLYLILFVICAIIVVLYLVFKAVVKPPEVDGPSEMVITIRPTDNPDTDEDESQQDPFEQVITLERKEEFHTFLLMGSDDGNGNADTIMVGAFDVKNKKISVVSVPRDTLVDVSRSVKKINAAYGAGGVEQLLDELTPILGFRPDHYIKVDIQAFQDVVNLLGGVYYDVPEDMYHDDGAGFIINLKAGPQTLNGNQALQLVRYRSYTDKSSDLGRIRTQQKFLQQLAKQTLSISNVTKVNEFAKILSKYFDTDLSVTELAYFGTAALSLDFSKDITFATLPGDGTVTYLGKPWYYQLYPEECLEIINDTVNPYTTEITAEMSNIFQVK